MTTSPTCSDDWLDQTEEFSSIRAPASLTPKSCYLCQLNSYSKRILRVYIRECYFYVTVDLIRLDIDEGVVKLRGEETVNFQRLKSEYGGFYPIRDEFKCMRLPEVSDFGMAQHRSRDRHRRFQPQRSVDESQERNGILESFVRRLAENLNLEKSKVEETICHIMTSCKEILLELDYRKLVRECSQSGKDIQHAIINIFWQSERPNKPSNPMHPLNSVPQSNSHSTFNFKFKIKSRTRSSSVPRDRSKDDSWFEAADRGLVVPVYPKKNAPAFRISNTVHGLLRCCIHKIEFNMKYAFSWSLKEYFYHDFVYPPTKLSYARYKICKKISNSKVIVVEKNPMDFDTHFAYVLALNFYSSQKNVQRSMRENGVLYESIIRVDKEIPFVIRSLHPVTRKHIFHLVYKKNSYSRPSYENVFNTIVLLRDSMFRLRLKEISMCKIGCFCERLHFGEVLRMIEYVFLDTDIKVRIGLNLTKCWHIRTNSLKVRRQSFEQADIRLERDSRFFSCDEVPDNGEGSSRDKE